MGQVGSRADDVKYEINNHVLYMSLDYTPKDTVKIFADLTFNHSVATVDDPYFGNSLYPNYYPTAADPYSYVAAYYDTNFTGSEDWSDLRSDQLSASAGFVWEVRNDITLNSTFIYRWYDDDKAYLGDDNDGKVKILSVGLVKKF